MGDLIYKELCYKLTGLAYEIDNTMGSGFEEKVYANAFEELLKREKIKYAREVYYPITINGKIIAKKFFDFLIEDKIVLELKCGENRYKNVCKQVFQYLKTSDLKLGLVVRFTKDGVLVKRIPNLY